MAARASVWTAVARSIMLDVRSRRGGISHVERRLAGGRDRAVLDLLTAGVLALIINWINVRAGVDENTFVPVNDGSSSPSTSRLG